MHIGYARTSTMEQRAGLDAQRRDLKAAGCEKIFAEQVSSTAQRAKLAGCLAFLREGDVLVVTKPDRLARNTQELLKVVDDLTNRDIGLIILSMNGERLDTRNATAKMILTILGAVSMWEREVMLERQREGIAKAQAEGKYAGRRPTATADKMAARVHRLIDQKMSREDIAAELGISLSSVYRCLRTPAAAQRAAQ